MSNAIRRIVTVQPGGRIEINALELPVGTQAEVTVMEITLPSPKRTLSALLGLGRGAFDAPEEADAFVRQERDQWT